MFNIGLIAAAYIACWYVLSSIREKVNIIQSLVVSSVGYLCSHIVMSGLLLWIDQYSIHRTLGLCIIIWWIPVFFCLLRHKYPKLTWQWKQYVIPFAVCALVFPILNTCFGFYGMGQDEGVYQTQAILFMNGITERQFVYDDYENLESDEDRQYYDYAVSPDSLVGAYDAEEELLPAVSERAAVFHGLGTYSALLALCGSILGMHRMMNINGFMYMLAVFLFADICEWLELKLLARLAATVITACSPLLLWLGRSALTETGQTMILLMFIYLILQRNRTDTLLSGACIVTYAFFHVSLYAFMPFYILLYLWLYLRSREKEYLIAVIEAAAGYLAGFWMGVCVSYRYVMGNYLKKIKLSVLNENRLMLLVTAAALVCIGAAVLFWYREPEISTPVKHRAAWIRGIIAVSVIFLIYSLCRKEYALVNLPEITLVAFVILGGVIGPIMVYVSILFFTKQWLEDERFLILLAMFVYFVFGFGCFMMKSESYYYYFVRYLAMYIPLFAIMTGIILDRHGRLWGILTLIWEILYFLPYDRALYQYNDDTKVEWDAIYDITSQITEDDIVFLEMGQFMSLYFPIKSITGAEVYPVYDINQQIQSMEGRGKQIYCVTLYAELDVADSEVAVTGSMIRSEDNNEAYEDYLNPKHSRITHMPLQFEETPVSYWVYRYCGR
jgi:hypothetical protein